MRQRVSAMGACVLVGIAGCGNAMSRPDGAHMLTIELFRTNGFVAGDTQNATFLAVQDGDGAWATIAGDGGVYRVPLASDRYGVAIGCSGVISTVTVLQQTIDDGLDVRERSCSSRPLELDVVLRNSPASSTMTIAVGDEFAVRPPGDTTVALSMDPGPTEVFVASVPRRASRRPPRRVARPA
jgi:hypothetical protein